MMMYCHEVPLWGTYLGIFIVAILAHANLTLQRALTGITAETFIRDKSQRLKALECISDNSCVEITQGIAWLFIASTFLFLLKRLIHLHNSSTAQLL